MRLASIILFLALLFTPGFAREFKDAKGRTIHAKLVAHAGTSVVIDRGGKEFVVPVTMFSIDDQAYIADWIEKNPGAVRYKFDFYTDLKREHARQVKEPGSMTEDKLKVMPYTYEMIVYNKETTSVQDIEVRYEIYVADFVDTTNKAYTRLAVGGEKTEKLQTVAGSFKIDEMKPGGRQEFKRTFNTESYIDRDGGRTDAVASDKIIGLCIRVLKNGKVLDEHREDEDSARMKRTRWQNAATTPGTVLEE